MMLSDCESVGHYAYLAACGSQGTVDADQPFDRDEVHISSV